MSIATNAGVSGFMSAESSETSACLGYCGRTRQFDVLSGELLRYSECGACNWGERSNSHGICAQCERPLSNYDWMFLMFIFVTPLLLHMHFVRRARKYCRIRSYEVTEHLCCILENLIACLFSVLIYPPRFSFELWGCDKSTYREWYPSHFNPVINYTKTMRCSYEVVFPLYTLPFVHNLVLIAAILLLRTPLYCFLLYKAYNGKPYYYALLSLPILAGIHAVLAGFLYFSYPWVLSSVSVVSLAHHFATEGRRSILEFIRRVMFSPLTIGYVILGVLMFGLGVGAILSPLDTLSRIVLIVLIPTPVLGYVLTLPFSHPSVYMLHE